MAVGVVAGVVWPLGEVLIDCTGHNPDRCEWGRQLLPFTLPLGATVGALLGAGIAIASRPRGGR